MFRQTVHWHKKYSVTFIRLRVLRNFQIKCFSDDFMATSSLSSRHTTLLQRLLDVYTSYRYLIDAEATSCVYWVKALITIWLNNVSLYWKLGLWHSNKIYSKINLVRTTLFCRAALPFGEFLTWGRSWFGRVIILNH